MHYPILAISNSNYLRTSKNFRSKYAFTFHGFIKRRYCTRVPAIEANLILIDYNLPSSVKECSNRDIIQFKDKGVVVLVEPK